MIVSLNVSISPRRYYANENMKEEMKGIVDPKDWLVDSGANVSCVSPEDDEAIVEILTGRAVTVTVAGGKCRGMEAILRTPIGNVRGMVLDGHRDRILSHVDLRVRGGRYYSDSLGVYIAVPRGKLIIVPVVNGVPVINQETTRLSLEAAKRKRKSKKKREDRSSHSTSSLGAGMTTTMDDANSSVVKTENEDRWSLTESLDETLKPLSQVMDEIDQSVTSGSIPAAVLAVADVGETEAQQKTLRQRLVQTWLETSNESTRLGRTEDMWLHDFFLKESVATWNNLALPGCRLDDLADRRERGTISSHSEGSGVRWNPSVSTQVKGLVTGDGSSGPCPSAILGSPTWATLE